MRGAIAEREGLDSHDGPKTKLTPKWTRSHFPGVTVEWYPDTQVRQRVSGAELTKKLPGGDSRVPTPVTLNFPGRRELRATLEYVQ